MGMRTEASRRFEHGIDPAAMPLVAARACALMAKTAGGRVARGAADEGVRDVKKKRVSLRPGRIREMLSEDISDAVVAEHLTRLGFAVRSGVKGAPVEVEVPSHRHDIEVEADLIEEVARMHGFEGIAAFVPFQSLAGSEDRGPSQREAAREGLVGLGFSEVLTTSFMTRAAGALFGGEAVEVTNPTNKEAPLLRTSILPGLLGVATRNRNLGERDLRIFEIGKVFTKTEGGQAERWLLAGAVTGEASRASWDREPREIDYYDGKGLLWGFMEACGIDRPQTGCYDLPILSSGAAARVSVDGRALGHFGMLASGVAEAWDLESPVFVFELELDAVAQLRERAAAFSPLPRYPKVRRDVALVVAEDTKAGEILDSMRDLGEELLVDVDVFDVYCGSQVPPGSKSVAFSLTYMSHARTLTDREVDGAHARVVEHLCESFRATVRK